MKYRITILCDNTVGPLSGTIGEHGFAALVEWEGDALLFDTGQGDTLLRNAQRMAKDLHRVRQVVLSHGHYDHAGGLWQLLRICGGKEIFAHPGIFAPRYRVKDTGDALSIGIPYPEEFLIGQGARFSFSDRFREIGPGIFLTGEVPRTTPFEVGDTGLYCDAAGCAVDPIRDDQSLVIRTERGLVLLLGCCHAGLVNTIEHAREATGVGEVHAVIGGTHLGFCGNAQLEETVKALRGYDVRKILGSHCTGFHAAARLAQEFPGRFQQACVGYTVEI
ncbi:MAG: MBL fold metallo-hydrolase [Desulfuromonadales bacterium]|nr:MAG: MBL fold metallo-hydrolase [Desulfuromonadales bacterium]